MSDLWCIHLEGPDDIIAMPSKDFAALQNDPDGWLDEPTTQDAGTQGGGRDE